MVRKTNTRPDIRQSRLSDVVIRPTLPCIMFPWGFNPNMQQAPPWFNPSMQSAWAPQQQGMMQNMPQQCAQNPMVHMLPQVSTQPAMSQGTQMAVQHIPVANQGANVPPPPLDAVHHNGVQYITIGKERIPPRPTYPDDGSKLSTTYKAIGLLWKHSLKRVTPKKFRGSLCSACNNDEYPLLKMSQLS